MVEWLFLAVPRGCLQFVIVVFPDHTHLLFLCLSQKMKFFEKFSLTKLCAALQRKDWKEVEKQQNKLGLEQFLARRGIGSRKPVAIVRPILKSSK